MAGFASFDDFLALPRVLGLTLSGDGSRLVATIAELDEDRTKFVNALWEIDPSTGTPARRLTRSTQGESGAAFAADGSLLFVSARGSDDDPSALWTLPPVGEARRLRTRPGGVDGVLAARDADTIVITSPTLPGSADTAADEKRVTARKDAKVSAALYRSSPVRYWDHDLGQDEPRLFATSVGAAADDEPLDLTPAPGRALDHAAPVLTADGATIVVNWDAGDTPGLPRGMLMAIDTTTGAQRVLLDDPPADIWDPAVSRDGTQVVAVRGTVGDSDAIPTVSLVLIDLASGATRELLTDPDVWPESPMFAADGTAIFFTTAERGEEPVFRIDIASGDVTRVTASGHYANVLVAPDGLTLYALRDAIDSPPRPVRLDATATDGEPIELPAPGATDATGSVETLHTTVEDGTSVQSRLVLPDGASADSPAPLLLWIHGGPLGSWNAWSWRWNPWLMVGRGYAVVLPDPALSVGYGASMIERGWGQWGGTPYTDLMAVTDDVVARPDVDETRTAAMGGSYGGYLANWVAGHTDRFTTIVTHASLWYLDQFMGTTDVPGDWAQEWGLPLDRPEHYAQWSPNRYLDRITTPMLVIHGDKDYRVGIGEALALWWDLQRAGVESAYLYYPDEGHWVLKPGNARVWYETVWAWLDQHVHGKDWVQPELL